MLHADGGLNHRLISALHVVFWKVTKTKLQQRMEIRRQMEFQTDVTQVASPAFLNSGTSRKHIIFSDDDVWGFC